MSERASKKFVIVVYVASRRKRKECSLDDIDRLIDWKPFGILLRKKLNRIRNTVDNPVLRPYRFIIILLLQRWYYLNDVAAEECLYSRLSFVRFAGHSLDHDEAPNSTSLCRFRQSLLENIVLNCFLDKLDPQLEKRGLLVRKGVIVDARFVHSSCRPLEMIDILPEDREEDDGEKPHVAISCSDEVDAVWLRRYNRYYYSFKVRPAPDSSDGFLLRCHVTPTNRSDPQECADVLDESGPMEGSCVYADKGYSSQLNRHAPTGARSR